MLLMPYQGSRVPQKLTFGVKANMRSCWVLQEAGPAGSVSLATDKFAAALKVKQAAAAGRFDEVEAELRRLDDNFFADSHPKVQQPC